MKRIFLFFLAFVFTILANCQIATLNLVNANLGCETTTEIIPSNQMNIQFNIDIMPGGGVWVEWKHLGSWFIIENSIRFTNPDQFYITVTNDTNVFYYFELDNFVDSLTQTGLYDEDSMYRFRYVDILTEQYFTIDTFYAYCPHTYIPDTNANTTSIENNNYNTEIIKTEYYNLSGQSVREITQSGIYVVINTYNNGYQTREKKYFSR